MRLLVNDFSGHPFQVQLSRELARRGHEVLHTYCTSFQTPRGNLTRAEGDPSGFEIRGIGLTAPFSKYRLLRRWRQEGELGRRMAEVVRMMRPDAVLSANTPLRTQAHLQRAARAVSARFAFWVQDAYGVGIRMALRQRLPVVGDWAGRYFEAFERRMLARSDAVVLITEAFRDYLPASLAGSDRVHVVENWAPLEEMPVMDKDNPWSREQGLTDTTNFVYTGTLGFKHNPELLAVLAEGLRDQPEARVVVVSEGEGADYLAAEKARRGLDNLILLPFQPFERLPEVLGATVAVVAILEADAGRFAVPSKVLTYLCCARPLLLAVPLENLSARIVQEAGAGRVVAPSEPDELVAAARDLAASPQTRDDLGRAGRAYAERTFNISAIGDRFEGILQAGVTHDR